MRIAIIGDYDQERPSHVATSGCLRRTSRYLSRQVEAEWLPTPLFEADHNLAKLLKFDGVWGAPGDPDSQLGMINAIQFAREKEIPYLGT